MIDDQTLLHERVLERDHVVIVVMRKETRVEARPLGFEDFPWPMSSGRMM